METAALDLILLAKAALMGIVEGLTEFLPISSTGHLILAGSLLGFAGEKIKVFEIAIQSGAILAVIIVYRERLAATLAGLGSDERAKRFALNVAIAFVPAVILGLLFGKAIKAHLFTPVVVATTFIVGAFVILWAERRRPCAAHRQRRRDAAARRARRRPLPVPRAGPGDEPVGRDDHRRHAARHVAPGAATEFSFFSRSRRCSAPARTACGRSARSVCGPTCCSDSRSASLFSFPRRHRACACAGC
jgi:hypothetical protein